MTAIEHVTDWRAAVRAATAHGERFAGAWASDGAWRAAFTAPGTVRVLSCPADHAETIVDLVGAAEWDEREARDLHGLRFPGHEPHRALVAHPAAGWTTPVTGDGVHEIAVGPVHAGVIESGHFRFHAVGDRVLLLDPRLFYKHRGLERAAEGRGPDEALAYAQRACAACAVANTIAYAQAVEEALGLWPDRALRVARTLLLELERLYNHLHDIGALCSGVGFAPGAMAFAALKERAQRLNAQLIGHRFLFGSVAVARGVVALTAEEAAGARAGVRALRTDAAAAWRELEFAASLQARLDGVGVLGREDAERLGTVGPAARAAGVRRDVREDSPRLWFGSFTPAGPLAATGDVAARLQVRAAEIEATCSALDEVLSAPVPAGAATARDAVSSLGIGRVESPRGATTCAVELAAGRVTRLRLRTASYANWPAVAHAAAGCLLPDFPLINKSFELCYACVDR
ncbi:nickel-dependent hydrogenase large subunit [Solirubrobacter ginsenosidimutans]|uniref:Nickel-dependent hydrogenase large subunit n=1 Tax=Solirubrobacter ginsenosidimutans TaxID=490573 RepID=A0A9X3S521_9ACTN|nr:nickel-dependent hydrogenase large subunit [Solirubrobacter ginsenosidimutans]MDA0163741.1 nickel-dependent hydrogenase large subunit [Solirubrobacter ginsenosidimutans]